MNNSLLNSIKKRRTQYALGKSFRCRTKMWPS